MPEISDVAALVGEDLRTVGFAVDGQGVFIGRFAEEIDPALWRETLLAEWPKGEGAVMRALNHFLAAGAVFARFDPMIHVDPNDGTVLGGAVDVD